jgi:EAL domain-containing protein (putative c-di-GMP-specific phosphodiesterase class I)
MDSGEVFAHELLGRGGMPGVPTSAPELFALDAGCSMEGELSKLFRTVGLQVCCTRKECRELFVNVHPAEMRDLDELARQLGILQEQYPKLQLTVEIHESLVTNPAAIQQFRAALAEHSIKIAYDDFGAGQARLMELVESPPDYLKFDRSLVENIHMAQRHRRQMVEMLVRYASNLGVTTLAEGVEMREEAAVCKEIGFHCAQGFYFGRPQPLGDLTTTM